jgi:ferredoxin-NADP reductase
MGIPAPTARPQGAGRDQGFHPLRVSRIVRETADTTSFVLDVPEDLRSAFSYDAGQFCNVRVVLGGQEHQRCYSMSSSPDVDAELQVTVKRVPDGVVSNWMNDELGPDDIVDVGVPTGLFRLGEGDGDVVAFGAGSGITPIFSILKTALATTARRVRLLYANRDRDSVIFAAGLDALHAAYPGRLTVHHHHDVDHGFVDTETVRALLDGAADAEYFVCGPGPFMDIVERTLLDDGVGADRIRIERFTPADPIPAPDVEAVEAAAEAAAPAHVTINRNGKVGSGEHRPGTTILQMARELGLSPPYSCESGNCATCMAKLVQGEASMRANNALTPEEVADGWVLTCQALPTSATVHVVYE